MKKTIMFTGLALALLFGACNSSSTENKQAGENAEYSCPMHPEEKSDKPGSCSKCGMDLEKVESNHEEMDSTMHH
jgi:uncharacterized low-complexity protein